jgi:hypothetical protein
METPSSELPTPRQKPPPLPGAQHQQAARSAVIVDEFDTPYPHGRDRLILEIATTRRWSTIHLAIGCFAAAVAVGILGSSAFYEAVPNGTPLSALHWGSRIAIGFFVGGLSGFFLRLHKAAADQIRYYHGEVTNIEERFAALNRAGNAELSTIIKAMAATERNPVLKKGDTTTELEKARIDSRDVQEIVRAIEELPKRFK